MKGRKRVLIVLSSMYTISVFLIIFITVTMINNNKKTESKELRKIQLNTVKKEMQSYVEIAYSVVDNTYKNYMDKEYLSNIYGSRLRNIIDISMSVAQINYDKYKNGEISEDEAKKLAKDEIKKLRYNTSGYIWINDNTLPYPKMIMHPIKPSLDGQVLDNKAYNCALGKGVNLFQAFVVKCNENGEGYVDYLWPKPTKTGLIPDVPKLSYVREFKQWNWILGTGIYIDDAIKEGINTSMNNIKNIRYHNGVGYFWINDMSKPFSRMIMHSTKPSLDGKILDNKAYNTLKGNKSNIFNEMVRICDENGEGFVEYSWVKPTKKGVTEEQYPKLSYVKLYKPLNWVIGTGVYIDDINERINEMEQRTSGYLNKLVIVIILIGIFVILVSVYAGYKVFEVIDSKDNKIDKKPVETKDKNDQKKTELFELTKILIKEQTKIQLIDKMDKNNDNNIDKYIDKIEKLINKMK